MPAFHDWKAMMDSLVVVKERFSRSSADAWSGKHETGIVAVWFANVPVVHGGCDFTARSWICRRSSSSGTDDTGCIILTMEESGQREGRFAW
jgi:hypothetical protein